MAATFKRHNIMNNCSVKITFERDGKTKVVECASIVYGIDYIQNVVVKNGWKFISMARGIEYKKMNISEPINGSWL